MKRAVFIVSRNGGVTKALVGTGNGVHHEAGELYITIGEQRWTVEHVYYPAEEIE